MINNDECTIWYQRCFVEFLLLFLIFFPLVLACILLGIRGEKLRDIIVTTGALVIGTGTLYLLIATLGSHATYYLTNTQTVHYILFLLEIGITLFILYLCRKYHQRLVALLVCIQMAILIIFGMGSLTSGHATTEGANLFFDEFSIIMALIIGIIGSLICIYSLGYMRSYHLHHPEISDRRPFFFFLLFLFLSAMFGLVFSNNLVWLFFFWEITTVCSFLLIGYAKTKDAIKNGFLALLLNLLGGITFAGALVYITYTAPSPEYLNLSTLTTAGPDLALLALVPAGLISFAGLTKSAQMPFSSWLIGAMVAPTPVSALLHSSTMVKAGVYVIVRFAPVLEGQFIGMLIALVGGITFFLASCIAITQNNAKKLLAYSTIANLGLVVACAGVGSHEAVWAAILLIIFHAVAKSLLFLCTGTVEHQIGSRDIEEMNGLFVTMPKVATMMLIGMAGMFLAPFGMLISKWATLRAFVDASPPLGILLVLFLALGSGVTVFFWTKWMGKLIGYHEEKKNDEESVNRSEWAVLYIITGLVALVAFTFPLISGTILEPYLISAHNATTESLDKLLFYDDLIIILLMLSLIVVMPLSLYFFRHAWKESYRKVPRYVCGREALSPHSFTGSIGVQKEMGLSNYYLEDIFGELRMLRIGDLCTIALIVLIFAALIGMVV
ncbi:MAG: NADH-quinone oxidoreductase subunit L [Methanospirillaceae archaeon]|nr:NADH-quinone oxidoreductase subunit L [Methanospirillaceae archaeon]